VFPDRAAAVTHNGVVDAPWTEEDGDVLLRSVRWNGRPRLKGDLWVTHDGLDWRRGRAAIRWRDVVTFDVLRVGTWETEGGRSLYVRDVGDPRTLPFDVVGAIDAVIAARYRGMHSHLIVETRRSIHIFTSGERHKRTCQGLRPAVDYFAV
jgi:hypothetical protein